MVNAATITVGDALIPSGLGVGDSFHFIFGTPKNLSSSADINSFNTLANNIANNLAGNSGSTVASIGATWTIVGSGVTDQAAYNAATVGDKPNFLIDAINNAPVTAAVYLINGTKIADDSADLWDGTLDAGITIGKDGLAWTPGGGVVHTGTLTDGTIDINQSFGITTTDDGRINRGVLPSTTANWINAGNETDRTTRDIYVMSEKITIVAVPEPASTLLGGLGFLFLLRRRR